ncbi:MAG: DUF2905 domain-containing protein [Clostridia bacterium]|nr:MAG: DUF2905 domain-containing protein [Clostridia bacterium]
MEALSGIGKMLILIGAITVVFGLVLVLAGKLPQGFRFLGRLPGDIIYQRGNLTFYFPLVTSLLLSLVMTIVLSLLFRR